MTVTFTLTTLSTAAGPFNISGTTSGDVTSELATGVTKNQLSTGHTISGISELITGGTIASTGTCTTTTPWYVNQATPTPTPTSGPLLSLITISSGSDGANCCTNISNNQYTISIYGTFTYLVDGDQYFNESTADTIFNGNGGFYSDGSSFGKISTQGRYTQLGICPS
jgi:hypothetical protein